MVRCVGRCEQSSRLWCDDIGPGARSGLWRRPPLHPLTCSGQRLGGETGRCTGGSVKLVASQSTFLCDTLLAVTRGW
jgi:hypothetical protein